MTQRLRALQRGLITIGLSLCGHQIVSKEIEKPSNLTDDKSCLVRLRNCAHSSAG